LTNPAKQNIIPSIRGSKRQVADIKSEPRPASNRNQWPASFWNAWPASSESACCVNGRTLPNSGHLLAMCRATTGVDDEVREGDVER
jgi:hypothetical protein